MAGGGSQLKKLKASLREQGVIGPQQSKKQKKQNAQNGVAKDKRISRSAALNTIREEFNPFEFQKGPARKAKHDVTTQDSAKGITRRPGLKKSQDEAMRREAQLEEQQGRRKVGGILDKRFGENDPSMAPEDKMLERFTREKQIRHKNSSVFDLEEDDSFGGLTHMGQSLNLDGKAIVDDYGDEDMELSDAEDHPSDDERQARKRQRSDLGLESDDEDEDEEDRPERKKSKQEVMSEIIAKSKDHKYQRQQQKDDDEDAREEIDKQTAEINALLRAMPRKAPQQALPLFSGTANMNPDRAALLSGVDKIKFDKEYDLRLKQLAKDKKAVPTEKSKPEEQKVLEQARRLQELEAKRLRRMRGEAVSDDEMEEESGPVPTADDDDDDDFGLGAGIKTRPSLVELGVEDEDEFLIDDDLVASGSEMDSSDEGSSGDEAAEDDKEDDEFIHGLLTEEEQNRPEFLTGANARITDDDTPTENGINGDLAYKFACPNNHEELLEITEGIDTLDLPTVVQRIRALYHPQLSSENKGKLAKFSVALVDHISHLANQRPRPPLSVLELVIRHIHSLSKSYPVDIANAFRRHLNELDTFRSMSPNAGDLVILTAISTIFPTSDHFHQVVTPAILSMGRYLGLKIPQTVSDLATGAYLCSLCLEYQKLSKRYVPEAMNFLQNTLYVLAPTEMDNIPTNFPSHEPKTSLRIKRVAEPRRVRFYDCVQEELSEEEDGVLKISLVEANLSILEAAATLWQDKAAFTEVFEPCLKILNHLSTKKAYAKLPLGTQSSLTTLVKTLTARLNASKLARRPLELHHHRPLAIKTAIPKFEESFNPERHYDPDRERTEAAKLKKEHKREKKGAIRELRKDANILAISSLKEKKERDAAYEKKYRRLVAEIQGEEGRESKQYEREKEWRKKGKK